MEFPIHDVDGKELNQKRCRKSEKLARRHRHSLVVRVSGPVEIKLEPPLSAALDH